MVFVRNSSAIIYLYYVCFIYLYGIRQTLLCIACPQKSRDASTLFSERPFVCGILDRFEFAGLGVGARENSALHHRRELWSSRNRADRREGEGPGRGGKRGIEAEKRHTAQGLLGVTLLL